MDAKISLQELAQILAEKNGLVRKDAESFVRMFFDTVSEKVVEDKLVKIKGLGTFKLIEVLDRESINVNTGERIVIPGHSKISFTPDAALKDKVNKPFADFQPVIINEGTDIDEMEKIDTPVEVDASEEIDVETPSVDEPEETPQEEPVSDIATEEPDDVSSKDEAQETTSTETSNEDMKVPESVYEAPVEELKPEAEKPEETTNPEPVAEEPVKEVVREVVVERTSPVSFWKVCAYVVLVLVLMLLSYFAGYYKWLCPCICHIQQQKTEQIQKPAIKKQPVSPQPTSLPKKATPVKEVAPVDSTAILAKKFHQVPGGKYLIVGTKKTRILKTGEHLYKLSKEEYGSKEYVQYIIVHNQFANPDNIPLGCKVKIPELRENK